MIKITFEGIVKRIYDETRGTYTSKYLVVTDGSGKYPNVLRFKFKQDAQPPTYGEGAPVKVSAYLDGREWIPDDGRDTMYFTDLRIDTVEVLTQGSFPAPAQGATDWKSLVALGAANGEDEAAIKARCEAFKAKVNRRFTPEDYAAVGKEILAAHANNGGTSKDASDDWEAPF